MSKRTRIIIGLVVAILSIWVGAIVITLLPEGTLALHTAALATTLIGLIGGGMFAVTALD